MRGFIKKIFSIWPRLFFGHAHFTKLYLRMTNIENNGLRLQRFLRDMADIYPKTSGLAFRHLNSDTEEYSDDDTDVDDN